ncbi:hypothetical protein H0H87_007488 [Tephrocybe sp. NHM501043]|nr:hypothetical protein H0H87_007488 [Tephrocybe sp. NHM501043]
MGGAQSLFYPDNPNRRSRAQQLADDCQAFQNEYDMVKREIENELGPYKDKMYEVLNAFGCRDLEDLDKLVKHTATKEGLQQWQEIKTSVGGLSDASDVFTTAMAVVAIAGIAISVAGTLAGGFGFLAGMAVTSSILAVLGVIGLIYDAISGAIQRSQLQDAINSLFKLRIQIKYLTEHARNMKENIGGIKIIYAIFEKQGYNKEKIIQELRESDTLIDLQKQSLQLTHMQVTRDLLEMDKTRIGGSWRDEDPAWEGIAGSLDAEVEAKKIAAIGSPPLVASNVRGPLASEQRILRMGDDGLEYVVPETSARSLGKRFQAHKKEAVSIRALFKDVAPILQGPVTIILKEFVNDTSAAVYLITQSHGTLKADTCQAHQFANYKIGPFEPGDVTIDVYLKVDTADATLYLRADGKLDSKGDVLAVQYD